MDWKWLPDFPEYAANHLGQIMRLTSAKGTLPGRILIPVWTSGGLYVSLPGIPQHYRPLAKSDSPRIAVARFVAYTRLPPPISPTCVVGFRDGNPRNVAEDNLFWYRRKQTDNRQAAYRLRKRQQHLLEVRDDEPDND